MKSNLLFYLYQLIHKLFVKTPEALVMIEPNTIIRGSVFPTQAKPLTQKAQELFEAEFDVACLDEDELYAGKICAALDRQHPRDLFDMHDFFVHRNLTKRLGQALVIYLASSPRPIHERPELAAMGCSCTRSTRLRIHPPPPRPRIADARSPSLALKRGNGPLISAHPPPSRNCFP